MNKERRYTLERVELRTAENEPAKVRGYAAVFEKESDDLGYGNTELREVVSRGAFDAVLNDDVRALFNHDPNFILARSKGGVGTLKIGADDVGLWYEFEPPTTNAGRDLVESMKRGDVDQSSFAFSVAKDGVRWEETTEGGRTFVRRTILKIERLFDVSPVTYPAYPDATVALRSLEEFRKDAKPDAEPVSIFPIRSQWAARFGCR